MGETDEVKCEEALPEKGSEEFKKLHQLVKIELPKLSREYQELFWKEFRKKSITDWGTLIFWCLLGSHYLHLRQYKMQVVFWLVTIFSAGVIGLIWWIVDLFCITAKVTESNRELSLQVLKDIRFFAVSPSLS